MSFQNTGQSTVTLEFIPSGMTTDPSGKHTIYGAVVGGVVEHRYEPAKYSPWEGYTRHYSPEEFKAAVLNKPAPPEPITAEECRHRARVCKSYGSRDHARELEQAAAMIDKLDNEYIGQGKAINLYEKLFSGYEDLFEWLRKQGLHIVACHDEVGEPSFRLEVLAGVLQSRGVFNSYLTSIREQEDAG